MQSSSTGESARDDVRDAPDRSHVGEDEMGCCSCDVDGKPKCTHEQRNMDDPATDAKETRNKAHPDAVKNTSANRYVVSVGVSLSIREVPGRAGAGFRLISGSIVRGDEPQ